MYWATLRFEFLFPVNIFVFLDNVIFYIHSAKKEVVLHMFTLISYSPFYATSFATKVS